MTNVIDLFSGSGGWDIAAHRLGVSPVGLELDDDCCATRKAASLRTMQCDIAAVHLTPQCGWYPGRRGLIASPPCQGFSRAGKGKGLGDAHLIQTAMHHLAAGMDLREQLGAECADSRSMLVVEPLRWALALEPRWIALEQVPSVLPFWDLTAEILGTRGYHCWTGLLHAEQFGVPQTRKRAFLIASLDGPVGPPAPTHSKYHVRDPQRLDAGVLPWLSMAKALGWDGDERVGFPRRNDRDDGGEYRARDLRPATEPAFNLTEKARSWSRFRPAPTVGTTHGGVAVRQRRGHVNLKIDEAAALQSFPRIWLRADSNTNAARRESDRPAPTMRFAHNTGQMGWVADPADDVRQKGCGITVAEAAAFQSYPAGFPFQGSRTSIFRQIGNAVCPAWAIPILGEAMRVDWRQAHAAYLEELYG